MTKPSPCCAKRWNWASPTSTPATSTAGERQRDHQGGLHPYPADLHIVTKVGGRRGVDASWRVALNPDDLQAQVRQNLQHLGLDVLDVVNLRVGRRWARATRLGAPPQQTALAWLLQRSETMIPIPGTSSVAHLRENVAAADLALPEDAAKELDGIARWSTRATTGLRR